MGKWLAQLWQRYTRWCDKVGLNPENGRCCIPKVHSTSADTNEKQPGKDCIK